MAMGMFDDVCACGNRLKSVAVLGHWALAAPPSEDSHPPQIVQQGHPSKRLELWAKLHMWAGKALFRWRTIQTFHCL